MRTHEGKTRYVMPDYIARHRASEVKGSGFTYGSSRRWVAFTDLLEGPQRAFGLRRRYEGCSAKLAAFFERLHHEDAEAHLQQRRAVSSVLDTVTMSPVPDKPGRHRLRAANQWPTVAQNP